MSEVWIVMTWDKDDRFSHIVDVFSTRERAEEHAAKKREKLGVGAMWYGCRVDHPITITQDAA